VRKINSVRKLHLKRTSNVRSKWYFKNIIRNVEHESISKLIYSEIDTGLCFKHYIQNYNLLQFLKYERYKFTVDYVSEDK
jgi:hypothetical protein